MTIVNMNFEHILFATLNYIDIFHIYWLKKRHTVNMRNPVITYDTHECNCKQCVQL